MNHYAQMLTLSRLRLPVHLGVYAKEQAATQPVEISVRLYFPKPPACALDDDAAFINYASLAQAVEAFVAARRFRLLEFMAQELFTHLRGWIDAEGSPDAAIWLKVNKCAAPVEHLQDGASYVLSDLPAGATAVAGWP